MKVFRINSMSLKTIHMVMPFSNLNGWRAFEDQQSQYFCDNWHKMNVD